MFGYHLDYTVRIFKELNNGNQGRSKHWSSAHRERQSWRKALDTAIVIPANGAELAFYDHVESPPSHKQGLVVRRVLGTRQRYWDADSVLRGSAKELIDSLVESGVAYDDNIQHITWVLGDQDADRRTIGPFTEVEVWKQ
jgi:hypothetical protein